MKMLHFPHFQGWDHLARSHMPVARMFLLFALPLSLVPPLMIYYSGTSYGGELLPEFTRGQLQSIGVVFFLAETAMLFLMAMVIQRLGEVIDIKPSYEDAFKLAVIAPTPLWLAPLAMFIPSFAVNLTVGALAILAAGVHRHKWRVLPSRTVELSRALECNVLKRQSRNRLRVLRQKYADKTY